MKLDRKHHGLLFNVIGEGGLSRTAETKPLKEVVAVVPKAAIMGYCPIIDGMAFGRFGYYGVAENISDFVVRYRDLKRFGYEEAWNPMDI